jgi:hypothetical protein
MDSPKFEMFPPQSVDAWHGIEPEDTTATQVSVDTPVGSIDIEAQAAVAARGFSKPESLTDADWIASCIEVARFSSIKR